MNKWLFWDQEAANKIKELREQEVAASEKERIK